MDRISLPLIVLGFILSVADSSADAKDDPKLNVLFICADDLNCDIGAYGDKQAKTPNIDRLAAQGVTFMRAYTQFPLCSPSRSSFLTGRRPNVTGVHTLPSAKNPIGPHFREAIPETVTMPQLFKKNGWFSVRIGKMYHYGVPNDIGTGSLDDYYSWDYTINPRGRDRDEHDKIFSLKPGVFGATLSWLADEGADEEQSDGIAATEAIKLLERMAREKRPFFLGLGFYRPHTPYVAPKQYFDLHPAENVTLPALSAQDRDRVPAPAYASSYKEQDEMTDEQRKQAIQAYHASISFMDAQLGRVLDALDRLGLAENTVIVMTSDHGYHLADHGLWQKQSLFERSARVPLIIAAPKVGQAGARPGAVVEMLDIYPTLADLAGLKAPAYLEGVSLRPMLQDVNAKVKDFAYSQTRRGQFDGYTVRDARWRYTEWANGTKGVELYDEENDPAESRNLAADPANSETVAVLKAALDRVRPKAL
jgi:choline-sulfatase